MEHKTKLYLNRELYCMSYPVGSYINSNMRQINLMCELIQNLIEEKALNKEKYLVCRGSSGAIIAGIIASKLGNCRILHVKKPGELSDSHASNYFSLDLDRTFIIVDDFIATGSTINTIYKNLLESGFPTYKQIDILCVSGNPELHWLDFKPTYVLCEKINNDVCRECGGKCIESKAFENTYVAMNDFGNDAGEDGSTMSKIGEAELINCYKCTDCGHSFTVN